MKKKIRKNVWLTMHDVRPLNRPGDSCARKNRNSLATKRASVSQDPESPRIFTDIVESENLNFSRKKIKKSFLSEKKERQVYQLGRFFNASQVPIFYESSLRFESFSSEKSGDSVLETDLYVGQENIVSSDEALLRKYYRRLQLKRTIPVFVSIAGILLFSALGAGLIRKGIEMKKSVTQKGNQAYASLASAKEGILSRDFEKSELAFSQAKEEFAQISGEIDGMGAFIVEAGKFLPFVSKISSGSHLAKAGEDISQAGLIVNKIIKTFSAIKNPLSQDSGDSISFLNIFQESSQDSRDLLANLEDAEKNLNEVNLMDLPEDKREKFAELKKKLPEVRRLVGGFLENSDIFTDILGGNGPRKYLFLFQNNQEMRATGGFIGSYAALDISNGRIKKFIIDGIFNPDGQLREKFVPPSPIQKISAAWSLHDSNWFPDFPVSAEKAALFYEKTGGPTVDGVIAMTPTVLQKLLEITGPIELPEYDMTVDKDNFIEKVQYEVEIDYDKEQNKPKQILADLAPKILDKIFNAQNFSDISRTLNVLSDSLSQRQIIIYSKNYEIEKKISEVGWSGEILDTDKDYLSVINTNINGFKTDGVIEEAIEHNAEIQEDGSVIDTLTITRHHNGGNTDFEWWNKVNSDWLRVYVPKGSKLISAEGQTREFNSPPLDYGALNFKRDPQVQSEEENTEIDPESGTRIYEDAGKTVFANWTYVSPQETMTLTYKYLLPFKISINGSSRPADTYSLLAQKQSGSLGSKFIAEVKFPEKYKTIWTYPEEIGKQSNGSARIETDLETDKFMGLALVLSR